MNALQAIQKIRIALGIQKFEVEATLEDGVTKVHVDGELAPGEQLHVVAEDGSFVPAPEGTHTTQEGVKITVDAAGVITAVEEKAAEALEEEKVEEGMEVEEEKMEEIEIEAPVEGEAAVAITEEVITAVVEAIAPIVEEVAAIAEEMKKMKASFAKFSNEPAGTPVRNNFSKVSKGDNVLDTRLEALAQLRKKK
jgi:hypothetical protein